MGADIHSMTTTMAEKAAEYDARVTELRGQAEQVMAKGTQMAERVLKQAKADADEITAKADEAEETAARWRKIAHVERETAGLPPLDQIVPPVSALAELDKWVGPDGRVWPMADAKYRDAAGAVWHYAGAFEQVDGVNWPVMSQDDYSVTNVPFLRIPGLTPIEGTGMDTPQAAEQAGGRS